MSKFHHTDYVRLLSRVSNFSYTSQDSLRRLINDNDCYQDIDQLCHSWVQELYNWDDSVSKMPNASDWNWSRIHPCFCIRHGASLTKHKMGANNRYSMLLVISPHADESCRTNTKSSRIVCTLIIANGLI